MTDLTEAATLLTALRDLLELDPLDGRSPFRERTVEYVREQLDAVLASGRADRTQVTAYGADREVRSDLAHALYGSNVAANLARVGKI